MILSYINIATASYIGLIFAACSSWGKDDSVFIEILIPKFLQFISLLLCKKLTGMALIPYEARNLFGKFF